MRLFVAIALPSKAIDALESIARGLRTSGDGLRWSSSDTWHITLQFLGETTPESFECVVAHLAQIRLPHIAVALRGTGIFGRAGVFWAGVHVSPELQRLERQVVAATANCGFQSEDRPYHPHVTLARAKGDDRSSLLRNLQRRSPQNPEFPPFIATEFLLYESHLGPRGASHEVRQRFPLRMA